MGCDKFVPNEPRRSRGYDPFLLCGLGDTLGDVRGDPGMDIASNMIRIERTMLS